MSEDVEQSCALCGCKERARIVELVRGLMCPPGNEDCDMCIAYRAVITTIEANP